MRSIVMLNRSFGLFCSWSRSTKCFFSGQTGVQAESIREVPKFDVTVVGGGIVGLATAREMKMRHPNLAICLLEKEKLLSMHQSGHNSGVIHGGIYYTPGSLKAKLCVDGLKRAYAYCDENNIKYRKCGKLIVATNPVEVARLENLVERGIANKVPDMKVLDLKGIREVEPNCVGIKAIHSPHTGIVNWREVAVSYGTNFSKMGGQIFVDFEVVDFLESTESASHPVVLVGRDKKRVLSKYVVVCGGLHADRLAQKSGCDKDPMIVPFRGDYLLLKPERSGLVNGNIYPVPDPQFPFLGVHFTPKIDGSVWLGPNAVLSLKREGYSITSFDLKDALEIGRYPGMWKIAMKHFNVGLMEMFNLAFISRQVKLLQRFMPCLKVDDVVRGPCGVRAQALGPDGNLVDDFIFHQGTGPIGKRLLHIRNAPSPAATSSMGIAMLICDKAKTDFEL